MSVSFAALDDSATGPSAGRLGVLRRPRCTGDNGTHQAVPQESCDYCGATALEWRKRKLAWTQCRQIDKSCADL